MASAFERLGGEPALRAIIDDFVARVFDDAMIGFFFRGIEERRIRELEYQHAAEHLGGPVRYRGRSLREAHSKHPIRGGHFDRRKQVLREALDDHGVPTDIRDAWLDHVESLRPEVTGDSAGRCDD
jgi:hemoglobin